MSTKIERIEITCHQLPLDPPFPPAWDTQPRKKFPATIVRIFDGDCYNEICEFTFDDEKTGHGYYYQMQKSGVSA